MQNGCAPREKLSDFDSLQVDRALRTIEGREGGVERAFIDLILGSIEDGVGVGRATAYPPEQQSAYHKSPHAIERTRL